MNENPAQESSATPVCPRHPDRVSYVRCQRCGRPTCVECQRPAAVGVQCVDCVAASTKAVRSPRTAFGGRVSTGKPVVTITMIALCVASFLLQNTVGWSWTGRWIFIPWVGEYEPYRFLSAAFLHASNPTHLLFNMYALWITGQVLEPVLGRLRFTSLYLLSALGGSVAVLLLASPGTDAWITPVLGASGAVFGLFGALLVVLRRFDQSATQIFILIGINMVISFTLPGISWQGHLGGLVVGAVMSLGYAYVPRPQRQLAAVLIPVLTLLILVALTVLKYAFV